MILLAELLTLGIDCHGQMAISYCWRLISGQQIQAVLQKDLSGGGINKVGATNNMADILKLVIDGYRERKLIKKIDKTLVRVEEDDYGFCDQCGVEVGIRRLEARPTADLCVDCKTLDEIKEKQITGG